MNINKYICNYFCKCVYIPKNCTSKLLQLLLIFERLWQYILMDFKNYSLSKKGFNAILIIINYLRKRPILIFCYKIIIAKNLTKLFIVNIYCYYKPLKTIVLNRDLQFIFNF